MTQPSNTTVNRTELGKHSLFDGVVVLMLFLILTAITLTVLLVVVPEFYTYYQETGAELPTFIKALCTFALGVRGFAIMPLAALTLYLFGQGVFFAGVYFMTASRLQLYLAIAAISFINLGGLALCLISLGSV